MGAILGSIVTNLIEVAAFVLIAWGGIMCGKSMASKKAAKNKDTK